MSAETIQSNPSPKLKEFLKKLNGALGENTGIIIGQNSTMAVEVIPTGIFTVDRAIGAGGVPRGKITEIFGLEASGKSTLCLHIIAEAQKLGHDCMYIDAEHALNPTRMAQIGVDFSKLVICQPASGEEALSLIEVAANDGKFAVVIVDSVAALVPQQEVEKDMGESPMASQARLMSQAMRKLTHPVSASNIALVFVNQVRSSLNMYSAGEVTPGGSALRFYSSLRIKVRPNGFVKDEKGNKVSQVYKLTVVKNKLAVPFKECQFEIVEKGFDDRTSVIDLLLEEKLIQQAGSWIKCGEESIAQGKRAAGEIIFEDPKWAHLLEALKAS